MPVLNLIYLYILFFFKDVFIFHLKGKVIKRKDRDFLFCHSPNDRSIWSWAVLKPKAWSFYGSLVWVRGPKQLSHLLLLFQEPQQRARSEVEQPCAKPALQVEALTYYTTAPTSVLHVLKKIYDVYFSLYFLYAIKAS